MAEMAKTNTAMSFDTRNALSPHLFEFIGLSAKSIQDKLEKMFPSMNEVYKNNIADTLFKFNN